MVDMQGSPLKSNNESRGSVLEHESNIVARERYSGQVAVAAVDVLGVCNLVNKGDDCALVVSVLEYFVNRVSDSRMFDNPANSQPVDRTHREDVYFGDAVYLFADPELDLAGQIVRLQVKVSTLVWMGLYNKVQFLVSGAIAVGDLREKTINTPSGLRQLKIGTSMVRAMQLEEAQDWVGAAIDSSVSTNSEIMSWTSDFPVPVKTGFPGGTPRALNWIPLATDRAALEQKLKDISSKIGADERSNHKVRNTMSFIEQVFLSQTFAPFEIVL